MADLNAIVQRMIDAGESEDNIATVIRASKASPVTDPRAESRRELATGPVDDAGQPLREQGGLTKWFETELRPMLEKVAHPQTISDIAQLLIPDANIGGVLAAGKKAGQAVANTPIRRPLVGALDVGAAALDNPIVGVMSPRASQAGKLLGGAADFVRGKPAEAVAPIAQAAEAAAPVVKVTAGNPSTAMTAAREAFKSAGVEPLKAEASNVMELIRRGKPADEALQIVLKNRPAGLAQEALAVAKDVPKLTAEEVRFGLDLLKRGKTEKEAMDAILAQRAFRTIPGVMSDAEARAALDLRNARGQIKTPSAQTAAERYSR